MTRRGVVQPYLYNTKGRPKVPEFDSFVKATQAFFSLDPHGRKVDVAEFKGLTINDKYEISDMLNEAGYSHPRYAPPTAKAA